MLGEREHVQGIPIPQVFRPTTKTHRGPWTAEHKLGQPSGCTSIEDKNRWRKALSPLGPCTKLSSGLAYMRKGLSIEL